MAEIVEAPSVSESNEAIQQSVPQTAAEAEQLTAQMNAYIVAANKRVRALRKKAKHISQIKDMVVSGTNVNEQQLGLIAKETEVTSALKEVEKLNAILRREAEKQDTQKLEKKEDNKKAPNRKERRRLSQLEQRNAQGSDEKSSHTNDYCRTIVKLFYIAEMLKTDPNCASSYGVEPSEADAIKALVCNSSSSQDVSPKSTLEYILSNVDLLVQSSEDKVSDTQTYSSVAAALSRIEQHSLFSQPCTPVECKSEDYVLVEEAEKSQEPPAMELTIAEQPTADEEQPSEVQQSSQPQQRGYRGRSYRGNRGGGYRGGYRGDRGGYRGQRNAYRARGRGRGEAPVQTQK